MEWENFARRTPKYAKKLEEMGIKYHLSTAGYDDETKTTNTAIPGLRVENENGNFVTYSFDGKLKCEFWYFYS